MNEKASYINLDGKNIYTVLHTPDSTQSMSAFVFVHPFAEEKLWSHRVYVSFARELARRGYLVIRFDLRGHGDSEGDFVNSSLDDHLADIDCIVNKIKMEFNVKTIGLFGLRFGATLAATYASTNHDITQLILWDPVVDGELYMQEVLRSNLATQMAISGKVETTRDELINQMQSGIPINIDGYLLTHNYYMQISGLNLLDMIFRDSTQCLINQIVRNIKQPYNKKYQELLGLFGGDSALDKSQEEQFWKEIKTFYQSADTLSESSIKWLTSL